MDQELAALQRIYDLAVEFMVKYSFQVLGALIILVLGIILANVAAKNLDKLMVRRNVDVTLRKFFVNVARILILACFVIISLGKFGITIAPFIAALGAATFGVGLALQGPVSNYGAGLAIILSRPFKVGDTVTFSDVSGIVEEIRLANTTLSTEDGVMILVPNKLIIGEIIHNSYQYKIVEISLSIDYKDSPDVAREAILRALEKMAFVPSDPRPQVGIDGFGDFSIIMGVRFWVPMRTYYESKYLANLEVFTSLKEAGIVIPYPRHDMYFLNK